MLCSVFGKKKPNRGSNKYLRSLTKSQNMRMQASLLSTAALTAQVDVLKKDLERSERELGLARGQLKENEGKKNL